MTEEEAREMIDGLTNEEKQKLYEMIEDLIRSRDRAANADQQ